MTLYETLGIDQKATKDEIRKAYRKKAAKVHPDAGGDADDFHQLSIAHAILTDDAKRSEYDQTGKYSTKPDSIEQKALSELTGIFNKAIEELLSSDMESIQDNIVDNITGFIKKSVSNAERRIKKAKKQEKKLKKLQKRFKHKGKHPDIINNIFKHQANNLLNQIKGLEEYIKVGNKMLEMLKDYEFEADKWVTAFDRALQFEWTSPTKVEGVWP